MTLLEFQNEALKTSIYPNRGTISGLSYATLGLCGESGEVANKVKKAIRDGADPFAAAQELADVLWYCAAVADELGTDLDRIAEMVLGKLAKRQAAGTLQGSGENR